MAPLAVFSKNLQEERIWRLSYRCWNISSRSPFEYFQLQVLLTLNAHSSLTSKAFRFEENNDVISRRTDYYSFSFFPLIISVYYVYCFYLVAESYTNEKILCALQIFDIKATRNVNKANSNIFQFKFAGFFSL